MNKFAFGLALLFVGCGASRSDDGQFENVRIERFCADHDDAASRINDLVMDGWVYQGIIHHDGLDCSNVLFVLYE